MSQNILIIGVFSANFAPIIGAFATIHHRQLQSALHATHT